MLRVVGCLFGGRHSGRQGRWLCVRHLLYDGPHPNRSGTDANPCSDWLSTTYDYLVFRRRSRSFFLGPTCPIRRNSLWGLPQSIPCGSLAQMFRSIPYALARYGSDDFTMGAIRSALAAGRSASDSLCSRLGRFPGPRPSTRCRSTCSRDLLTQPGT